MTTTPQLELDFVAVRCPNCNAKLFSVAPTGETFSVLIKCRRCSTRRRVPVYLVVEISLAPLIKPDIDLTPENSASA